MLLGPFFVKFCALPEAVVRRCSIKKRVLHNFLGKRSHFFDKTAGWRPETLLKRNFSAGLFLCIFLCRLPFFRMFVYVLLKFDWLIFFFSRRMLPRTFFLLFSARLFKGHDCACSVLKSGGIFCPRGNLIWMKNDLELNKKYVFSSILHYPNNCSVNSTYPIKNDVKGFRFIRF